MLRPLWIAAALGLGGLAAVVAGCGGGAGSAVEASSPAPQGRLRVSITDAPACGYDAVWVTIERVRFHTSDSAGEGDAGWQEIVLAPPQRIELLALANGVLDELGQLGLPAGRYTQMRLVLADNSKTDPLANAVKPSGGSELPLDTPSGQSSGLKLKMNLEVPADKLVDLVIDFDACKSVVTRGKSGKVGLKPVLTATPVLSDAGLRVLGRLDPSSAGSGTQVSLQQAGVVIKSTSPAADGSFVLYPVPVGSYDLVFASPERALVVLTGVPVSSTAYTHVLPPGQAIALPASPMLPVGGKVSPASATVRALVDLSGGPRVEAAWFAVDGDSGSFTQQLPTAAPWRAAWVAPPAMPTLVQDSAVAGRYTLEAVSGGASQTRAITLTPSLPPLDFQF